MKKIIVGALFALLMVAGAALGSVSYGGHTVDAVEPYKLNAAHGPIRVTGQSTVNRVVAGRLLRNGVQVGVIQKGTMYAGTNYSQTVTVVRSCVNTSVQATWVTQARIETTGGTALTGWDSSAGRTLLC